jgi:Protein of unknown function (DUF3309)
MHGNPKNKRGLLVAKQTVPDHRKGSTMSLGLILLIIVVLLLLGVLPAWGHSRNWGYGPSGGLGLVLLIVVVLVLMGRI